ncbi:tetratricopeptide repeat protein [Alkalihalobacillus trypoxylicola]|uniref:Uncharacterized protein n=1 Tax=Alkalihalobacillus trypoxylicola TaxID=519424 RepID=A0A161PHE6_9BACI|nr:tetratricopeptide repeat protein [Alkalihalobacillus trypoxylicola]KYG32274.1 hypothetical protein AZF04_05775 [Alkalihalobacillus trypoxylicola]GAF64114.1 hypothetical protein BTS2_1006 [Bacillus sp. TS-2]
MSEKGNKPTSKIIPYPGLVRRLIEKGMDSLKEKNPQYAYQLFKEASNYEPDHPQVRFGIVLCLVELGRLEEAVEMTTALLHEDIGDYYDNLQVHISLLVQLSRYHEVVELLDAVLSENRLPANHAESFYQLLHFSRQMIADDSSLLQIEETLVVNEHALSMLHSEKVSLQWQGLQLLEKIEEEYAHDALIAFIENTENDDLLRSIALEILHNHQVKKVIHIEKFSRSKEVSPKELFTVYNSPFGQEVSQVLEDFLESENPNLLEMISQLVWSHFYALYPFNPIPNTPKVWACCFYLVMAQRMGIDVDNEWVEKTSNHTVEQLMPYLKEIEDVESSTFSMFDFIHKS